MLENIPDESIDLIYIDPPFNSNRNYEVFWGDVQEKRAFNDRFGDAQGRHRGYFVSFGFSADAIKEIKRLDKEGEIEIIPVTVKNLLRLESYNS